LEANGFPNYEKTFHQDGLTHDGYKMGWRYIRSYNDYVIVTVGHDMEDIARVISIKDGKLLVQFLKDRSMTKLYWHSDKWCYVPYGLYTGYEYAIEKDLKRKKRLEKRGLDYFGRKLKESIKNNY
jgi:hypothetical protein